jgi:hypothetical protein
MSSIKRRKVDSDVPSGLLKTTKKHRVQEEDPASSASPSPPLVAVDGPGEAEEETTKTFNDLVRVFSIEELEYTLTGSRVSSTRYATPVLL